MDQNDYIRIVPGADTGVLFIHGIAGTPEHFTKLIPLVQMVPESYSVYNLLLDGHGKTAKDFGKSSMKIWKRQVLDAFEMLRREHSRIILVGHSMGTLLAVQLALEYPQSIESLFLLAVPMRVKSGLRAMSNSLRLIWGKLRDTVPSERAMAVACGAEPTWKLWHYVGWIPRLTELLVLIHKTGKVIDKLTVPSIAFQSEKDELVALASRGILARNKGIAQYMLPNSTHFYYAPEDSAAVCSAFQLAMDMTKKQD